MSDRESLPSLELGLLTTFGQEADRFARIVRTIEGEIIPRLLAAAVATISPNRPEPAIIRLDIQVAELARRLLSTDPWLAGAYIQEIREDGVPEDRICLELLAPSARAMSELWETNECDLARFLTGLKRLLYLLQFITESGREE